jgi:hypothetical protein
MTKPKSKPKQYLVVRPVGITTGKGHVAAGGYVTADDLEGSVRRMLRTGAVVDLDPGVPAADRAGSVAPDPAPPSPDAPLTDRLTAEAAAADLPTLAEDSDPAGVVQQAIPVVLRFLAAHPHRGGDILAAERKRPKPRKTVVDAAKAAATAQRAGDPVPAPKSILRGSK